MDKKTFVSVIMNCYNSSKYLREAIDSVYAQTYKNWEIIFWDNASTDNSAEVAKSYDSNLRYFRSDKTVPLGKARNWAIEKARGEYIAFLDCDDAWLPQKLKKQVTAFEKHPDIDFIYSNYFKLIMPETEHLILGLRGQQPDGEVFIRFLYHYPVNMQTVMLRRTSVGNIEYLFDERLNLSEEFDFFMRILYKSHALYLNEPLSIYRIHTNMSSIKYMDRWADEVTYITEKLKLMTHSSIGKYSAAIGYLEAKVNYYKARAEMKKGNPQKARHYLSSSKLVSLKFFILYLITFLPPKAWQKIHDYKMKGIVA